MDLLDLKNAIAGYHEKTTSDFVINGVDLLLQAINNGKRWAQSNYDFEMCRQSVQVTINTATGGLLSSAQPVGGGSVVAVKKIEGAFLGYSNAQRPIEFLSKKNMTEDLRRRYGNLYYNENSVAPLAEDSPVRTSRGGLPVLVQQGDVLFLYPDSTNIFSSGSTTVYLDVIARLPDYGSTGLTVTGTLSPDVSGTWDNVGTTGFHVFGKTTGSDVYVLGTNGANFTITKLGGGTASWTKVASDVTDPTGTYTPAGTATGTLTLDFTETSSDFFLNEGYEFLFWRSIIEGNYLWRNFVPREEGGMAAPDRPLDAAWKALLAWDNGIVNTNTTAFDLD